MVWGRLKIKAITDVTISLRKFDGCFRFQLPEQCVGTINKSVLGLKKIEMYAHQRLKRWQFESYFAGFA